MAKLVSINAIFSEAISTPGATLYEEQLQFTFNYMTKAPSDILLICTGHAGTRKSSTMGFLLSMLDRDDAHSTKHGLVLSKMHKTVNTTIETIGPLVRKFTGRLVVREYGDKIDLATIAWALDGCPNEYGARWTHSLEPSEYAEMKDIIECLKDAVHLTAGQKCEHFSAIRSSAIWHILGSLNLIQDLGGKPKYEKKYLSAEEINEGNTIEVRTEVSRLPIALSFSIRDNLDHNFHTMNLSQPLSKVSKLKVLKRH